MKPTKRKQDLIYSKISNIQNKRQRASNDNKTHLNNDNQRKFDNCVEWNYDILVLIFSYFIYEPEELCKLRRVCKEWHRCASESFFWKKSFFYFFSPCPDILSHSPFLPNNNYNYCFSSNSNPRYDSIKNNTSLKATQDTKIHNEEEEEEEDEEDIPFFELFINAISSLPILRTIESRQGEEIVVANQIEETFHDLAFIFHLPYNNNKIITIEEQKMAVVASFLFTNQDERNIKLRDMNITIGTSFSTTTTSFILDEIYFVVPIARLFWAILHSYESILYPLLQLEYLYKQSKENIKIIEQYETDKELVRNIPKEFQTKNSFFNVFSKFNMLKAFQQGITPEELITMYLKREVDISEICNTTVDCKADWHAIGLNIGASDGDDNNNNSKGGFIPFIFYNTFDRPIKSKAEMKLRPHFFAEQFSDDSEEDIELQQYYIPTTDDYLQGPRLDQLHCGITIKWQPVKHATQEWAPGFMNASHMWDNYNYYYLFSAADRRSNHVAVLRRNRQGHYEP